MSWVVAMVVVGSPLNRERGSPATRLLEARQSLCWAREQAAPPVERVPVLGHSNIRKLAVSNKMPESLTPKTRRVCSRAWRRRSLFPFPSWMFQIAYGDYREYRDVVKSLPVEVWTRSS